MSNLTQFVVGGTIKVTTYTSGTGTFTPTASTTFLRITMVGGGSGGSRGSASVSSGSGGAGGFTLRATIPALGAMTYTVGAGGAGATADITLGTNGSPTKLGQFGAFPGVNGYPNANFGGTGGGYVGGSTSTLYRGVPGLGGGGGANYPQAGSLTGSAFYSSDGVTTGAAAGASGGGYVGGGGGGSSDLGFGGAGGAGAAAVGLVGANATGYGAGGGGGGASVITGNGGNGSGGYIVIEEF